MTVSKSGRSRILGGGGTGEGSGRGVGGDAERIRLGEQCPRCWAETWRGKRVSQGTLSRAGPSSPTKFDNFPEFLSAATPPGRTANPRRLLAPPSPRARVRSSKVGGAPARVGMVHGRVSRLSVHDVRFPTSLGGHGSDAMVSAVRPGALPPRRR